MPRPILFAVGQAGSAEYLIPLWRRWLAQEPKASWRVAASPAARERILSSGLRGVPFVADESNPETLARSLGDWKPELVLASASHASVEATVIAFARRHSLPVMRFIDTWYGYRNRLDADGRLDLPSKVFVINNNAIEQAIAEGLPREILEPVGQPAWEAVTPLPPADRRQVMFVSQPVERHYGKCLGYTEATSWKLIYETARHRPDLIEGLIFAPHPEDTMPPPKPEGIIRIARRGRDALGDAGTVVGMFSSLMVDALLAGRPVVSLQPGAVGSNMCGALPVPRATTAEELAAALIAPSNPTAEWRVMLNGSCDRLERALLA